MKRISEDLQNLVAVSQFPRKLETWKHFDEIRKKDEAKFLKSSKSLPGFQVRY